MDSLQVAFKNLDHVLSELRLTRPERRQLEGDLKLLYSTAMDKVEEEADGGTDK